MREAISESVELKLRETVNGIFSDIQKRLGIEYGDCDPLDAIKLDDLVRETADHIAYILEMQKGA